MIYLDAAATTLQKPAGVEKAVLSAMRTMASPGRGGHKAAMRAAEKLYECRERAARLFHVPDVERVAVTFNATHGLNIAIRSLVRPGDRVVISGYEHNSVLRPLNALGADIAVADCPVFDREAALRAFDRLIDRHTRCVAVNHVSNVFGFVLPVYEIAALCRERGVPLIVDASQSAGVLRLDASALDAAFIAMPGHKALYGSQGTGLLIASDAARPLLYGGSGSDSKNPLMPDYLPDMLEAGTHNTPGVAGLCAGMEFVESRGPDAIAAHERSLIAALAAGLSSIRGVRVFAAPDPASQAGVLSFQLDTLSCEEVGERLDRAGFAVRAGLHCAPLAHRTVGTISRGTVRASVSAFNTREEIAAFIKAVDSIARSV